jgi:hypothetical protein
MNRLLAIGLMVLISIVLAVLLILGQIHPLVGGLVFAVALMLLGSASNGFRGGSGPKK